MDHPSFTPVRRPVRGSKLTPSSTPYLTPSKRSLNTNHASRLGRLTRTTPVRSAHRRAYDASPSKTPLFGSCATSTTSTPSRQDDDRFIPSRQHMNFQVINHALSSTTKQSAAGQDEAPQQQRPDETTPLQKERKRDFFSNICNVPVDRLDENAQPVRLLAFGSQSRSSSSESWGSSSSFPQAKINPFQHDTLRNLKVGEHDFDAAARLSVAKKVLRKVPSAPIRILDAPDIVDDYYLNLISWSKDNILAVALAQSVYLWNATTGDIQHLYTVESADDYITSVCWCPIPGQTKYIAVGTHTAKVRLFDGHCLREIRTLNGHTGRVSAIAWNQHYLTSGARDSLIINHDVRQRNAIVNRFVGHQQEVCGLKWNEDGTMLASGGNENFLCLWDASMSSPDVRGRLQERNSHGPRLMLRQHKAAVKALDWCPFHRGLLASGGGTADRTIKFWNSSSGACLNSIDTGSQVCSIVWSKHQKELCSSHGYSENQLILWKYPSMTKIKELTGHTARVLNMEMSPDGTSVVSAAADETLRFWNVFGGPSLSQTGASWGDELSFGGATIR